MVSTVHAVEWRELHEHSAQFRVNGGDVTWQIRVLRTTSDRRLLDSARGSWFSGMRVPLAKSSRRPSPSSGAMR